MVIVRLPSTERWDAVVGEVTPSEFLAVFTLETPEIAGAVPVPLDGRITIAH